MGKPEVEGMKDGLGLACSEDAVEGYEVNTKVSKTGSNYCWVKTSCIIMV